MSYFEGTSSFEIEKYWQIEVCGKPGAETIREVDRDELSSVDVNFRTDSQNADGREERCHQTNRYWED